MPQKSTKTTTTDMGPWSGQRPYITETFSEAQRIYNENKARTPYQGDFVATMTPEQRSVLDNAIKFYTGEGTQRADNLYGTSNTLLNAGATGVVNSANAINDFAASDRTGAIINDASRIADNPYMSGMVDATMRDAYRNASENTIPNLYRDAAAGSNLNSSRTALSQGVVERGLAQKTADVSAALRGQAYGQGLEIGAGNQRLNLDALMGAGGLFDSAAARGFGGVMDATNMRNSATDRAVNSGELIRQGNQLGLDNDIAKFNYKDTRADELLRRYYGIIGDKSWGQTGTTTETTKTQPGAAQIAGGILGAVGSIFGGPMGLMSGLGGLGGMLGLGSAAAGAGSAFSGYNMTGLPTNRI